MSPTNPIPGLSLLANLRIYQLSLKRGTKGVSPKKRKFIASTDEEARNRAQIALQIKGKMTPEAFEKKGGKELRLLTLNQNASKKGLLIFPN